MPDASSPRQPPVHPYLSSHLQAHHLGVRDLLVPPSIFFVQLSPHLWYPTCSQPPHLLIFHLDTRPFAHHDDVLDVQVVIYSGNLDLICCTTGTLKWMKHLEWPDRHNFWHQPRNTITLGPNQIVVGFSKTYKNLQLWNILSAGHMVSSSYLPSPPRTRPFSRAT